jgi:histidine triad (HIT) family protein
MAECVFCKIVKKEVSSAVVYEDDKHLVFMDIAPMEQGHILVITKKHYVNLSDIPPKEFGELMSEIPRIAKAVLKATGAPSYKLVVNNGREAGQVIDHVHAHIIPFSSTNANVRYRGRPKGEELKAMAEKIKQELG